MKIYYRLPILTVVFTVALLIGHDSHAQKNTRIGIRLAGTLASQDIEYTGFAGDLPDIKSKLGYDIGVIVDKKLAGNFHILTGLHFAQAGYKTDNEVLLGTYVQGVEATVTYLQVPALLRWAAVKFSKNFELSAMAGPYAAYALDGDVADMDITFDGDIKRFDFGVTFGVNIGLSKHIFLDARYNLGIADISDVEGIEASANNQIFTFGVGYLF